MNPQEKQHSITIPRERQLTEHSSELSHSSINHIIHYEDESTQKIKKILNTNISLPENQDDLSKYCTSIIEAKFKESIKNNTIVPSENDNKHFKLKIPINSDTKSIKQHVLTTINSNDPKIQQFINDSIELVLLKEMKDLDRSITSIHENIFSKITFTSHLKTKFIRPNIYYLDIKFLSINFI